MVLSTPIKLWNHCAGKLLRLPKSIISDDRFPFKESDTLIVEISDDQLIIRKAVRGK